MVDANSDVAFNNWIIVQPMLIAFATLVGVPSFTKFTGLLIHGLGQALALGNRMEEEADNDTAQRNSRASSYRNSNAYQSPRRSSSLTNDPDFGAATVQKQQIVKELLRKVIFIRKAVVAGGATIVFFVVFLCSSSLFTRCHTNVLGFYPIRASWACFVFSRDCLLYQAEKRNREKNEALWCHS